MNFKRKNLRIPIVKRKYADFFDTVAMRKSVRDFSDKEIKDKVIEILMQSARWAPSWQNKQCFSYIIVKEKEMIKEITKASGIFNNWMGKAPVIIVSCANPSLSGQRNGLHYFLVDAAISTEHLVLAATALGLGTCWVGAFDEDKIKKLLKIPENIRVIALIPVGYSDKIKFIKSTLLSIIINNKRRKRIEDLVHYEKW